MRGNQRSFGAVAAMLTALVSSADAAEPGIGDGPVTILAQIHGAGDRAQHPAILFAFAVKGKLLGQKFAEAFHEEL